ncbi:MAG TPA: L-threonylcarbamoyladenylate synthase [Methanoregulaceae archaeon]|nr:L-threonylcarbamoyladenylate synthase [Methanoregulaceae archaeon]HOV67569.1 L-threonylcarbamoyladenylate synthase [Methanoregulaceae archaeon]HQJ87470.1 L-threonylcarbamoyladenylate synthase [Methanoregulaceae archaeon]
MDQVERAVQFLMRDGLVVYPTETVYGLGADALSDEAIRSVYDSKHRPLSQPISIAVADVEMLGVVARIGPLAEEFVDRFLPGPYTVLVEARPLLPVQLHCGTGLIGIRVPAHPIASELLQRFDGPITATSANTHGAAEPATINDVHCYRDYTIDAGRLPGTPSTVVDLVNRAIIRPGVGLDEVVAFLRNR